MFAKVYIANSLADCLDSEGYPTKPNSTHVHGTFLASGLSCRVPDPRSYGPVVSHFLCISIVDDVVVIEFLGKTPLKGSYVFGTAVCQGRALVPRQSTAISLSLTRSSV